MATAAHRVHHTVEDYLAFEDGSAAKHEFLDGQIYAMAGGTPEHAALSAAMVALLAWQLKGKRSRVYSSDLRLRIPQTTLITYPDASVICGPVQRDPAARSAAINPTLLAEVLSPSTAEYDRTDKFQHCQHLPTLKQYVLIDPSEHTVEVRTRSKRATWSTRVYREGKVVELSSVGVRFEVRELFAAAAEPTS